MVNTNDTGTSSLRWAITNVNASAGLSPHQLQHSRRGLGEIHPACERVAGHPARDFVHGVAVVLGWIHLAEGFGGLTVLPMVRDFQFSVRVDATANQTFIIEAATNLLAPIPWTPLLTTNVPTMPFDYVDFDVKFSEKQQKHYRVWRAVTRLIL